MDELTLLQASASSPYLVTTMRDAEGNLSPHYADEPKKWGLDFDTLMQDKNFAEIIEEELAAELVANGPLSNLVALAPNDRVANVYLRWLAFINVDLKPWTTGGAIHFRPHWARVLMHALTIGDTLGFNDADMTSLAMSAVFHDSRRKDPYLDTGHGARAAAYYQEFCEGAAAGTIEPQSLAGQAIVFDPRTRLAIQWHDRDDKDGLAAAAEAQAEAPALPSGAQASFEMIHNVLKDADALDRVRLGSSGLDPNYLRTEQAKGMIPLAQRLFEATGSGRD